MPFKSILVASLTAVLLVPSSAAIAPRDADASPSSGAPRPIIMLVHGRGHGGLDTALLRRSWASTLTTAAERLTGRSPFSDGDVSLVWYADALDPMSDARCPDDPRARRPRHAAIDEPIAALLGISSVIVTALTSEIQEETARELRNIAADLQYFADPEKRCAAEEQIGRAIASAHAAGRPVILIAHSMGAVVSWSYLAGRGSEAAPAPRVRRLVTLGSPIGSPDIRRLLAGSSQNALALPPSVESWINVVDTHDPFAVPLGTSVSGLSDVMTRDAPKDDPHAIEHYLRDPATVTAVVEAWCGPFDTVSRPEGCEKAAVR